MQKRRFIADSTQQSILDVLSYFSIFSYSPTEDDIYLLMSKKCRRNDFRGALSQLEANRIIIRHHIKLNERVSLISEKFSGQTKHGLQESTYKTDVFVLKSEKNDEIGWNDKASRSYEKVQKVKSYIHALNTVPFIKMIGLTGSCSMNSASESDDIDLFIISKADRVWTTRLIANMLAILYNVKRKKLVDQAPNKVCLNLFMTESHLMVPLHKQNRYVAHEIVQTVCINEHMGVGVYEKLLKDNAWIHSFFPNMKLDKSKNDYSHTPMGIHKKPITEVFAMKVQLFIMRKHRTTELLEDDAIWLFPHDFEKRLPKELIR